MVTIIILLLFLFCGLLIAYGKVDLLFWISLMMFFDPGGFALIYLKASLLGRLSISDVSIVFILIAFFIKYKRTLSLKLISKDFHRLNLRILIFLFIPFLLLYGLIMPVIYGYSDPFMFIVKNRVTFYGAILLPLTYIFHYHDDRNYFLRVIIYSAAIVLPLYFITLVSPLKIVPFASMERYEGTGIIRLGLQSYGFIHFSYPLALVILLVGWNKNMRNTIGPRNLFLFTGILMAFTYIVSLTRRDLLSMLFTILVIWWLSGKIRKKPLGTYRILMITLPVVLVISLFYVFFPTYLGYYAVIMKDAILLIFTGMDSQGNTDARISGTGGLALALDYIRAHPFFGSGYYPVTFAQVIDLSGINDFALAVNDSAEVPIYAVPMRMGLVGILFILSIYWLIIRACRKAIKLIKENFRIIFIRFYPELILLIFLLALYISKFTLEFALLGGEFINPDSFAINCVLLGIFFASVTKIKQYVDGVKEEQARLVKTISNNK